MNYWLHRISLEAAVSYPLLESGYITIGWSDFSSYDFINTAHNGGKHAIDDLIRTKCGTNAITRSLHSLFRFIDSMKIGDYVIIPSWGVFHVYEIISDTFPISDIGELPDGLHYKDGLIYKDEKLIDLGFYHKVKLIQSNISRNEYADAALISRMKILDTNANITDLADSINRAIERARNNAPINIYNDMVDYSSVELKKIINTQLNPDKFERLIKLYFEHLGADVEIPSKQVKEDGDADIIATFENLKIIIAVQAKFHKGATNDHGVKQIDSYKSKYFDSLMDGYSVIKWVVSSADEFSTDAEIMAEECDIQLIDGTEFARMLIKVGISAFEKLN